jgi:hypothetical protein
MRKLTVLSVLAVGLWGLSLTTNTSRASLDAATNEAVNGIADMLEKNDTAGAKKAAAALAKEDYENVMHGFKPRNKKGIGVGTKPGAVTPDGVELKINAIARDGITAPVLAKEKDALVRMGYVTQAMGQYTLAKPWEPDQGKKTKQAWNEWAEKLAATAQEFTAAAKAGSAADTTKAAKNIKNTCDGCHAVFK